MTLEEDIIKQLTEVRDAALKLGVVPEETRNKAISIIADRLVENSTSIVEENKKDIAAAREKGTSEALVDRLLLTDERIKDIADDARNVIGLDDPVGEVVEEWTLDNGLEIKKTRVPLGVVAIVYESRPNVTVDAAVLCLKSGNAVVLKGGSDAINTNRQIVKILVSAAGEAGLPDGVIQFIDSTDRSAVGHLLGAHGYVDVIIPRGGHGLISFVVQNSKVPVIETGEGNCHIYVDKDGDLQKAQPIVINAKTQRPGVCNAAEKLLVHSDVAQDFLPGVVASLKEKGVVVKGCRRTQAIVDVEAATEEDWPKEYLDLVIAIKVVDDVQEAIDHINRYSTKHSESIVSENEANQKAFVMGVDSAAVYTNASTRFTDGAQFEMGAEIGISTQKLHARGPMSVRELTSTKFVIKGTGQIRE